jgi:stringent starvation protein B
MTQKEPAMTSNRPYLIRALNEWICDNGQTPYLLVDASHPQLQVPASAVKDGRVVLNIAARAVAQLDLGNREIRFLARFGGVSQVVIVPIAAVLAIYAQESGQGMMLPEDGAPLAAEDAPQEPTPPPGGDAPRKGGHLKVVK